MGLWLRGATVHPLRVHSAAAVQCRLNPRPPVRAGAPALSQVTFFEAPQGTSLTLFRRRAMERFDAFANRVDAGIFNKR